jgi:hypothetical protein
MDSRNLAMSSTTVLAAQILEDFAIPDFDIFEHYWFRNESYRKSICRADYKVL